MTIQTIGRVRAVCDGSVDFGSRAVVTSGTGSCTVGRNIMLNTDYYRPAARRVTGATGGAIRQVACTK